MAESNLSQRLKTLHEVDAELAEKEAPLLGYLASGQLKVSDHNRARLDGLVTLVKSVITLRQLAHAQLRDLLLDQRAEPSLVSSASSASHTPSAAHQPSPEVVSVAHDAVDDLELETQCGPVEQSASAGPSRSLDVSPSPELSGLSNAEGEHDAELEALQREIASITQPIFEVVSSEAPERSSLLAGSVTPSLSDFPPFVRELEADQSAEVEMGHRARNPDAFADTLPPIDDDPRSFPQSTGELEEADELFPFSAGEAGTAIFDAESLKSAGISLSRPTIESTELKSRFYANVTSKRGSFDGLVYQLSVQEIFVKGRESLTVGEEVAVRFRVPGAKSDIECQALVREVNAPELPNYTPPSGVCLRFLNLRSSHEALIEAELNRQAEL